MVDYPNPSDCRGACTVHQQPLFDLDVEPPSGSESRGDHGTKARPASRNNRIDSAMASLERRILLGLSCEWDAALDLLDPSVALALIKPAFRLADMKNALGQWRSRYREIVISRRAALDLGWDGVRDILRHEMAHQLTDTLRPDSTEPPHGPFFQTACSWLRADPRASGTYPPLSDRVQSAAAENPDPVLNRVKKLLALATSGNAHEAEAAMTKAHQLIDRHNIDLIQNHRPRDYVSVFLGRPALRQRREAYHLAAVLSEFYFVEPVWVPAFVLDKERMGRVLEISGTPRNVIMAEYVHDFVQRHIHASWRQMTGTPNGVRRRSDFAVGVIAGFRETLTGSIRQPSTAREQAVIRRDDPQLAVYCRDRYPSIRTSRAGGGAMDSRLVAAGEQVGRDMVIHQGIEKTAGAHGGLIAAKE